MSSLFFSVSSVLAVVNPCSYEAGTMGRRKKLMWTWLTLLAMSLAAGLLYVMQDRSLLKQAAYVPGSNGLACLWASDQELLVFVKDTKKAARALSLNPMTGVQTPLTALTDTFPGVKQKVLGSWNLSPDGKWVAATANAFDGSGWPGPTQEITSVDGQHQFSWAALEYTNNGTPPKAQARLVWLPDSRRWLKSESTGEVRMNSLDAPDRGGIPLALPAGIYALIGVTPDYRLIASDTLGNVSKPITLYEIGLYPNPTPGRKFTVMMPDGAEIRDIALSPQGDRLAWSLFSKRVPPMRAFLAKLLPSLVKNATPSYGISLWTSRTDGKELRELGFQEVKPNDPALPEPVDLRWTPDGKRLSFRYKEALYVMSAGK